MMTMWWWWRWRSSSSSPSSFNILNSELSLRMAKKANPEGCAVEWRGETVLCLGMLPPSVQRENRGFASQHPNPAAKQSIVPTNMLGKRHPSWPVQTCNISFETKCLNVGCSHWAGFEGFSTENFHFQRCAGYTTHRLATETGTFDRPKPRWAPPVEARCSYVLWIAFANLTQTWWRSSQKCPCLEHFSGKIASIWWSKRVDHASCKPLGWSLWGKCVHANVGAQGEDISIFVVGLGYTNFDSTNAQGWLVMIIAL